MSFFHSVTLDTEKCRGCTNCLKGCPTQAIRVRNGKASIMEERCIDCGECIRACPYHAKIATTDDFSAINKFKYKIALPAPALYGQFKKIANTKQILGGLIAMGFDSVFEVARGADIVSKVIAEKLRTTDVRPLISSACPAVVRMIQLRFPELIDRIVDVLSPMEVAAKLARKEFCEQHHASPEEVGVFFITPCPAKMTSIRRPIGLEKSNVDGAISILDIYGLLSSQINRTDICYDQPMASFAGIGWANSGGEASAVGCEDFLAVDGIGQVIHVLEEIENNRLTDLAFFEGLACYGGCVGGPLAFENGFVAKNKLRKLIEAGNKDKEHKPAAVSTAPIPAGELMFTRLLGEQPVMKLDENFSKALQMMEQIEKLTADLPGLDCGSCGAPTCAALAEDIVRGKAVEMDCIFKLKERVTNLAKQMIDLSDMHQGE